MNSQSIPIHFSSTVRKNSGCAPSRTWQANHISTHEPQMPPPPPAFSPSSLIWGPLLSAGGYWSPSDVPESSNTQHLQLRMFIRKAEMADAFQNSNSELISLNLFRKGTLYILSCLRPWFWSWNYEFQVFMCAQRCIHGIFPERPVIYTKTTSNLRQREPSHNYWKLQGLGEGQTAPEMADLRSKCRACPGWCPYCQDVRETENYPMFIFHWQKSLLTANLHTKIILLYKCINITRDTVTEVAFLMWYKLKRNSSHVCLESSPQKQQEHTLELRNIPQCADERTKRDKPKNSHTYRHNPWTQAIGGWTGAERIGGWG